MIVGARGCRRLAAAALFACGGGQAAPLRLSSPRAVGYLHKIDALLLDPRLARDVVIAREEMPQECLQQITRVNLLPTPYDKARRRLRAREVSPLATPSALLTPRCRVSAQQRSSLARAPAESESRTEPSALSADASQS